MKCQPVDEFYLSVLSIDGPVDTEFVEGIDRMDSSFLHLALIKTECYSRAINTFLSLIHMAR